MANRSNSSRSAGAAKASSSCTVKSVLSWPDALSGEQSGLYDNSVRHEFSAEQETSETTCPVSSEVSRSSGLG